MHRTRASIVLAIVVVLAGLREANASWPMARHDAQRTGASSGSSDIISPTPYWRVYLGGALGAGQLVALDANGDGSMDVVFASGGQLVAKSIDDTTLWSVARAFIAIAAIGDVDGDGKTDIVAYSSNHVYVVAASTGAIEWVEPDGEIAAMGSVHVGDVTGDGKPDVVIAECGCCGVNSGNPGFIWTFGSGFGAAKSIGSLPVFSCGTSYSVTLGDAIGNGRDEVLEADYSHFAVTDGNGVILAQTGSLGTWMSTSACSPANVDGVPGDEFVCIQNSANAPATNQHRVFVLHYDAMAKPPTLSTLWSKVVAPDAGGDIRAVDPVVDLDGDGQYEVVVSAYDPNAGWTTHIMDAVSGAELTSPIANGATIQGTAALTSTKTRIALTSSGTSITGWAFSRAPTPTVTQKWQIMDAAVLTYAQPSVLAVTSVNRVPVALDLNGDGVDDLVVRNTASSGEITAYSTVGAPVAFAKYVLPVGTDPLSAWVMPPMTVKSQQVSLVGTDGVMRLFDGALNQALDKMAKPVAIRVGGYYGSGAWREVANAPRIRALSSSSKAESIVIADSRRALNRIDAVDASWAIPPSPSWSVTHAFAPTIVDDLASTGPGIACLALKEPVVDPPQYMMRTLRSDGTGLWEVALSGNPLADTAPGDFNGDGITDFVVQTAPPASTVLTTTAFSGVSGGVLWTNGPSDVGGAVQSPGVAIAHFGSSMTDNVYYQASKTIVLSGTGSTLKQGGAPNSYGLPILVDTLGVGTNSVVMTAGYSPVVVSSPDLQTPLYTSSDDDRPYPYAAVAKCGTSVNTLVEGSWANEARLKFTQISGGAIGTNKTIVLAGGKLYADEAAAKASGAFLGQLTAANVDANLTGANHSTAVVGSTDGWLYGVNPCNATLDFALDMGASVGEAIFGDTDGDGRDEIIVTVADGYLYDIKNEAIAKTTYVWDTDPDHGITDHDVDTVVTVDKLSGTWAPVAGATGYEVTVVTKDAKPVPNPTWKNVGTTTSASLTGLALIQNTQYFFVVRALSSKGPSVDVLSNGVTVIGGSDAGADAGPNDLTGRAGGCSCHIGGSRAPSTVEAGFAFAWFVWVVWRRRKRHEARMSRRPPFGTAHRDDSSTPAYWHSKCDFRLDVRPSPLERARLLKRRSAAQEI
nr:hypothetical protein Hi04_10k_c3883_00017 [uncultured bacterium]